MFTQTTNHIEYDMTTVLTQIEKRYAIEAVKDADFGENWLITANRALAIQLAAHQTIFNSPEQYITADEARKLGAGKAEWSSERPYEVAAEHWYKCEDGCSYDEYSVVTGLPVKYRAMKQPEPVEPTCTRSHPHELMSAECEALTVIAKANNENRCAELRTAEPHAELKAIYEQQVRDETTEFYLWEYRDKYQIGAPWTMTIKPNFTSSEYRCTPKPLCQIRNLDTNELKTMTREAAKKLQAELGDTVEWCYPQSKYVLIPPFNFGDEGIFTYKLKRTVRLTIDDELPKMLTPAQCEVERLARVDTHDFQRKAPTYDWVDARVECADIIGIEYRLIRKQPKLIPLDWKDVPVGVTVQEIQSKFKHTLLSIDGDGDGVWIFSQRDKTPSYIVVEELELAPASEQPWIVRHGTNPKNIYAIQGIDVESRYVYGDLFLFKVIGVAEGWELK